MFLRSIITTVIALATVEISPLAATIKPSFDGNDKERKQIPIRLVEIAKGLTQPTEVVFLKKNLGSVLVLEKPGSLIWYNLRNHSKSVIHTFKVRQNSELGLLGAALHPNFPRDKRIFIHYNPRNTAQTTSRISSFVLETSKGQARLSKEKIILTVSQPFSNHDGGHLAFGPDGYLYIGLGDGGSRDDPNKAGQDLTTLLGKMLRIDINTTKKPYLIPHDNPFIGQKKIRPEIWAFGLRNPWRYSITKNGLIIAGDVGQDNWEEITVIAKGENHGWRIYEGSDCYLDKGKCQSLKHTKPRIVYSRSDGTSVTGGYLYQGTNQAIKNHYLFGDFTSGRIWAVPMNQLLTNKTIPSKKLIALGRWPINISSFGRDTEGRVYTLDFSGGKIYRID